MYPVRNIVVSDTAMSFIIPGLDVSVSIENGAGGAWPDRTWLGDVSHKPDLGGKRFVTLPDGRQMYLDCRGEGSPVVVFDAGAGGWSKDWESVHDEIATMTMACVYDRPGHGLSDPRPLPLDTAAVADDLDAMLMAAGVAPPYVLVGHSLGSYHVRHYANTRFDKVAGMVLVDPSADGQKARLNALLPHVVAELGKREEATRAVGCVQRLREKLVLRGDPLFAQCNGTNDPDVFEQTQSEIDAMEGVSTEQLAASRRSYGDMPLIVLTRGDNDKGMPPELTKEDREGFMKIWTTFHEEMATLSSEGVHRFVPGAGHYIQRDQPQAVIDAVNAVVTTARSRVAPK
jgi:pimeloyl-ACP methyl ester carboxylesterase